MTWFEIFFKYPAIVYQKGKLGFQLLDTPGLFGFCIVGAVLAAVFFYRRVESGALLWVLVFLRAVTFLILAFILFRPVLNVSTVLPQESYLAVLFDNSQSMLIRDDGVNSRADLLTHELESTDFFEKLSEKFRLRVYRFDQEAKRIDDLDGLNYSGKRTRIESAFEMIHQELSTLPLSGIVLVTDGVDNASEEWARSFSRVQAQGIPIYTVGVGKEVIERDAELIQVTIPREILNDSTASVDVSYRSQGLSSRKATLQIRENETLIKSEELTLPRDGEVGEVSVELPFKNTGSNVFSFSIESPDDQIVQNNELSRLIEIKNDQPQLLYVEGEPRWEFRYIRRAVEDDPNLRLVTLLRTSPNKFYRQGIDSEEMLATGFPTTREELFAYKGLVLGSIEATFFNQKQLEMIVEFVSERGGGFLMIGGRNSFSEGRYQNTPVADILPVFLPKNGSNFVIEDFKVHVSDYGRTHPLMKLRPLQDEGVPHWDKLPLLTEFNRVEEAKSGAVVLANVQTDTSRRDRPVLLAYQRYGRGRTMVFTTSSSWRWQMEMDYKDMTHELFWRQIMRWLVSSSPDAVVVNSEKDSYLPGERVRLFADIADVNFDRMNNALVTGHVIDPEGNVQAVGFEWTGLEEGTYQTEFTSSTEGIYSVEVEASYGGRKIGTQESTFQVRDRPVEFSDAGLDSRFLVSIAEESRGKYYPLNNIAGLPEDAVYVDGESSIIQQREIWDVPLLFLLLLATITTEWFWRKKRGLA